MEENDKTWSIARTRHIPSLWPLITYWGWDVRNQFKVKTSGIAIHVFDKGHCTALFEKEPRPALSKSALIFLEKNINNLEKIRKKGISSGKSVIRDIKFMSKKAKKAKIEDFISFLNKVEEIYPKLVRDNMMYWLLTSELLESEIRKEISKLNPEQITEIFHTMSLSSISSYSKKEEDEFEKLIELYKKDSLSSKTKAEIKKFSKKYFWFPYEYVGPGIWDEETVRKRVEEESKKSDYKSHKVDVKKLQKSCIQTYDLSKKSQELFKILRTMTLMQDDRKMFNSQFCYYANGIILSELAKKLEISREEVLYIDQELISLYLEDENVFRSRIKRRSQFFTTSQLNGKRTIYEGEEAKEYLKSQGIDLFSNLDVQEIKGQVASPGKVNGIVRVLKTSHVTDFKPGNILVTGMTTPDFVVLMKKASAVITDEGGITSHAAIVSREVGIPCIIGTRNATKILQDGDEVEVDADKGIVRILKRAR